MRKGKFISIQILIVLFVLLSPSFAYPQEQARDVAPSFVQEKGWILFLLATIIVALIVLSLVLYRKNRTLESKTSELHIFNELRKSFIDADDRLIYLKDENLRYIFVNKALEKFYRMDAEDIIGKDDYQLTNRKFANLRRETDLDVLLKRTRIVGQVIWKGRIYRTNKFPILLSNGNYGVGAYIQDISDEVRTLQEKEEQLEKIQYLSFHDPLTGLYNRYFFFEEMCRLDTERNLPISIIMGDVDGLKLTNDIFGHAAGDRLLKKVAEVLRNVCRKDDIIARIGGDEFIILLPKTSYEQAKAIMDRISKEYSKHIIKGIKGNISLGCDTKVKRGQNLTLVMEKAELQMYANKTLQGKNGKLEEIDILIGMLHESHPKEKEHSKNVYKLCMEIGNAMALSEVELKKLVQAAFLHDIGKITMDPRILEKNDWSEEEWLELREHPITGFRILNSFSETIDLAEIILAHHERWDGSGYPKGLKGEEIPLPSRIIALAEYYDKMVVERNGKHDPSSIIAEIQRHSGSKFDPQIVKAFLKVLQEDGGLSSIS